MARTFENLEMRYSATFNKSLGKYALALSLGYTSHGEASARVLLFTGLAREPSNGQWKFSSLPIAATGAVSARAFINDNANGVMDAGEEPVKEVGF